MPQTDMPIMDKSNTNFYMIFLRDIDVRASIGIHDFEKKAVQKLLVNVTLILKRQTCSDDHSNGGASGSNRSDQIESVLDYDFVRKIVHDLVQDQHWALQESLCEAIAHACIQSPLSLGAIVSTAKTDVYTDTKQVGCRLARLKPELPDQFQWWTLHV